MEEEVAAFQIISLSIFPFSLGQDVYQGDVIISGSCLLLPSNALAGRAMRKRG